MKKIITLHLFLSQSMFICFAQDSSGPNNPGNAVNEASTGVISWSNPDNALSSDGHFSNAAALVIGTNSEYLVLTDFGFSIPASSTIDGITVEIQKKAVKVLMVVGSAVVTDNSVMIVKGGVIGGTDHASATTWSTGAATYAQYGHSSDAWGRTWTVADINAADFGIAISASFGGLVLPNAQIDHVRITVHYTSSLSATLSYFGTQCSDGTIVTHWQVTDQQCNDYFTVERSDDGFSYREIGRVNGAGTNGLTKNYSLVDPERVEGKAYYRLSQTDFDGTTTELETVHTNCRKPDIVHVFPNPAFRGPVTIHYDFPDNEMYTFLLYDSMGKQVAELFHSGSSDILYDTHHLSPGLYTFHLLKNGRLLTHENLLIH